MRLFIKVLICLSTIVYAAYSFFEGYSLTTWYPSFTDLRMGPIMMVLGIVLAIFSVLIFKKNNFGSLLLIISVALLSYGAFIYNVGFGRPLDKVLLVYLGSILFLYCLSKLIERKR